MKLNKEVKMVTQELLDLNEERRRGLLAFIEREFFGIFYEEDERFKEGE